MLEDSAILDLLLAPLKHFTDPGDRLSLLYQFSALIVAVIVYVGSKAREGKLQVAGLVKWLVPLDVLRHPSAQIDFAFFFVNRILGALIYGSILFWTPIVSDGTSSVLTWAFGPQGPGFEPSLWISISLTFVALVMLDVTLWALHYVFHVVPFLWDYHKVHHSAEVMTPITAARMHPVEEISDSIAASVVTGATYATFTYIFGDGAVLITIFDVNIMLCVFFLAAFNLRHSHVWVRYPTWLQHIFICPAQHQIHHSRAYRHWDKNMGFVFSMWDWAAGTLYAPTEKEDIVYGLGTDEDGTWNSLTALYLRPFRQSYDRLVPGRRHRREP